MKKHGRLLISILLLFLLIILPQDGHITAATIHEVSDLDPQAPRKSLTARFVINHSECNKKYYLHLIIYRTFIVNCYILF